MIKTIVTNLSGIRNELLKAETKTTDKVLGKSLHELGSELDMIIERLLCEQQEQVNKQNLSSVLKDLIKIWKIFEIFLKIKDTLQFYKLRFIMNITQKIGVRMRMIRTISGQKQSELAERLNMNSSLLSMYENGKREPSITFLYEFCSLFDMPLDQFFISMDKNSCENQEILESLSGLSNNLLSIINEFEVRLLEKRFDK